VLVPEIALDAALDRDVIMLVHGTSVIILSF
jgi:hypothetical protein